MFLSDITATNICQSFTYNTHQFNGPLSGTTQVSWYQKGKTNLDFTEARDSEWQWHQLGHMQVCTSLQTDNHASTPPLGFSQAGCPSRRLTNSVEALLEQKPAAMKSTSPSPCAQRNEKAGSLQHAPSFVERGRGERVPVHVQEVIGGGGGGGCEGVRGWKCGGAVVDGAQRLLELADVRSRGGVAVPAALHQLPAVVVAARRPLRTQSCTGHFLQRILLVAWHSARTSVSGRRTFPVLRSTCS